MGVALLMGFRSGAGVLAWLAIAGILILFTLALTWLAVIAGPSATTVDSAPCSAGAVGPVLGISWAVSANAGQSVAAWVMGVHRAAV